MGGRNSKKSTGKGETGKEVNLVELFGDHIAQLDLPKKYPSGVAKQIVDCFVGPELKEDFSKALCEYVNGKGLAIEEIATDEDIPVFVDRPRGPAGFFKCKETSGAVTYLTLSSGKPYLVFNPEEAKADNDELTKEGGAEGTGSQDSPVPEESEEKACDEAKGEGEEAKGESEDAKEEDAKEESEEAKEEEAKEESEEAKKESEEVKGESMEAKEESVEAKEESGEAKEGSVEAKEESEEVKDESEEAKEESEETEESEEVKDESEEAKEESEETAQGLPPGYADKFSDLINASGYNVGIFGKTDFEAGGHSETARLPAEVTMAHTAHSEEDVTEYFDQEDVLEEKLDRLAELVLKSKFFVAYTGAGISTSAGIPDFRGPQGVWTLKAKGEMPAGASVPKGRATPTFMHMALKSLVDEEEKVVKSGIDPGLIAELHGNTNVEMCPECGHKYYRAVGVKNKKKYPPKGRNKSKLTGRPCEEVGCDGKLRYTTVSFNQSMPNECLRKGTSMRVTPVCDLPTMGADKHRGGHALVIVNLQTTPYDDMCALRLFARVDVVMAGLCKRLNITVRECVKLSLTQDDRWMSKFSESYPFRSAPDSSWFK